MTDQRRIMGKENRLLVFQTFKGMKVTLSIIVSIQEFNKWKIKK